MGVCAHADWPVDKLSGLDVRAPKIECMCTGAQVCTHESSQRRQLDIGAETFLWAHELLHGKEEGFCMLKLID